MKHLQLVFSFILWFHCLWKGNKRRHHPPFFFILVFCFLFLSFDKGPEDQNNYIRCISEYIKGGSHSSRCSAFILSKLNRKNDTMVDVGFSLGFLASVQTWADLYFFQSGSCHLLTGMEMIQSSVLYTWEQKTGKVKDLACGLIKCEQSWFPQRKATWGHHVQLFDASKCVQSCRLHDFSDFKGHASYSLVQEGITGPSNVVF